MGKFTVKFRGTRGSYPTAKKNFLKFGGNTACVEVKCANQMIILDCGTGIIDIGKDIVKEAIINQNKSSHTSSVFISHIHQDHIQGLQFFKPLYNPNSKINVFGLNIGAESLKDSLKTILFDKAFPLGLDEIECSLAISNFSENQTVVMEQSGKTTLYNKSDKYKTKKDDIIITSYKTTAHPKYGCLCIKIEYNSKVLVYATDKESYIGADKRFIQFAQNCDVLIHDAQYTYQDYINPVHPKQGYGHSTFEMAIETAQQSKAKKLFFFHYDPDYDDTMLEALENRFKDNKTFFAKENLEIEI